MPRRTITKTTGRTTTTRGQKTFEAFLTRAIEQLSKMNITESPTILNPGEEIKPQVSLDLAIQLAETLYGLRGVTGKELNGYDDKNFHLKASSIQSNHYMTVLQPSGYVLKVLNSLDSKKLDYVEGQNELLLHLDRNGIVAPQPQKNINGHYYSVETLQQGKAETTLSRSHVVRLLTYQEGIILKDVPWSNQLFYNVGKSVAELDQTLESFSHKAYDSYNSLWMLKNVPQILKFLYALDDEVKVRTVKEVVEEFQDTVLSKLDKLKSGMIHGDANEQNILCSKTPSGDWEVCALLDYGDAHYSAYLFNLAITMTYMILQGENLTAGGYVLSGYSSVKPLPEKEICLLQTCISARICQSLVIGTYSYLQDPGNEYILSTQKSGWEMLFKLRQSVNSVQSLWKSCLI